MYVMLVEAAENVREDNSSMQEGVETVSELLGGIERKVNAIALGGGVDGSVQM